MMIKNMAAVLMLSGFAFFCVGGSLHAVTADAIDSVILSEQEKVEYLADQLGIFKAKKQSTTRRAIQLLSEYKMLTSVGLGLPLGALAGVLANKAITESGYTQSSTDNTYYNLRGDKISRIVSSARDAYHDVCVTATFLSPIVVYLAITLLSKSVSSNSSFYRKKLESFLIDWHKHKHSIPDKLEPLFQELYEHYLVYGHRLLFDDVLIQELIRRIARMSLVGMQSTITDHCVGAQNDVSVHVTVNDDRDRQAVGYGSTITR